MDIIEPEKKDNHVLLAQDTYVYGKGYLGMDKVEVPEKYMTMNIDLDAIKASQEQAEGETGE